MRFITADYIFPISEPPIKNGVIGVHEDGMIENVLTPFEFNQLQTSNLKPQAFSGIICPGFINSHCHLELSHLKGKFLTGKGLPDFIGEIVLKRDEQSELISESIIQAEDEMIGNGIIAVGDICNTTDTIHQKKKGRLKYHNFIEIFDLHPDRAEIIFTKGKNLLNKFKSLSHSCSLTPHAPYSVSEKLLTLITKYNKKSSGLVTIHNQETGSENEMFLNGSGALFEKLSSFGNLYNDWKPAGTNSLAYLLNNLSDLKMLLVHNTYSSISDIDFSSSFTKLQSSDTFPCFCPNANLFIENRLPDFNIFTEAPFLKNQIVVGTDSYASNHQLSILSELKTISKNSSSIKLHDLLKWATLNGANFFGWQNELGSIEKGKKPGLNLITNIDLHSLTLTSSSEVKPLLN